MRRLVIGTAGHIDHGKTALTQALTGVDTDRLPAEKQQGISIELGFAPWRLSPELTADIIDVPGHEKFIKTMVAGVAAIDLVLLVIAANEGVKPQTREHLDIIELLGVRKGVIVLTKCDLATPEQLTDCKRQAQELVQSSSLATAPLVTVSVKDEDSLQQLRQTVITLADTLPAAPARDLTRLPVDRCFTIKGFGTIVTGTLWSGRLALEQTVQILPGGKTARIRRLEVNGKTVESCTIKERVAVNLAGIERADCPRGSWLCPPGTLTAATALSATIELLPQAAPLKHNTRLRLRFGAQESFGRLRLRRPPIQPGEQAEAIIKPETPIYPLPGDIIILAAASPVQTIGRAVVEILNPPLRPAADPPAAAGLEQVQKLLRDYHSRYPLRSGMPLAELRQKTAAWLTETELQSYFQTGKLQSRDNFCSLPDWQAAPTPQQQQQLTAILQRLNAAPFAPPNWSELTSNLPKAEAKELLNWLLNQGCIQAEPDLVFSAAALQKAKALLLPALASAPGLTLAAARNRLQTSRKYALPILEYFDGIKLSQRQGDVRRLHPDYPKPDSLA